MVRPLLFPALLVLVGSGLAQEKNAESGLSKAALRELAPSRLFAIGWESEKLDLDFRTAVAAYRELALRPNADVRRRLRGYERLFHILRLSGRFVELGALTRRLAQDETMPKVFRPRIIQIARVLERDGKKAQDAFQRELRAFTEGRRKLSQKAARSREHDRLRRSFSQRLRKAMAGLHEVIRHDLEPPEKKLRISVGDQRTPRERQLANELVRIREKLGALQSQGRKGTEEWKRTDARRRQTEQQLRVLARRRRSTPAERRRGTHLRVLEARIVRLDRAGRHAEADRTIDEAEQVLASLPAELRPRFVTVERALQNPIARRTTMIAIRRRLPGQRDRIRRYGGNEAVRTLDEYARKIADLIEAKRWRDAARVTEAYGESYDWFPRLWQGLARELRKRGGK